MKRPMWVGQTPVFLSRPRTSEAEMPDWLAGLLGGFFLAVLVFMVALVVSAF